MTILVTPLSQILSLNYFADLQIESLDQISSIKGSLCYIFHQIYVTFLFIFRPVSVTQHISWRMAAGGIPLFHIQSLTAHRAERKKLSRTALYRQNLAKLRFLPSEKRYGFFKQPCRHIYNYWYDDDDDSDWWENKCQTKTQTYSSQPHGALCLKTQLLTF